MTTKDRGKRPIFKGDLAEMKGFASFVLNTRRSGEALRQFPLEGTADSYPFRQDRWFSILAREQDTILRTIRCEIESHTFDPARYVKADLRKFSFDAPIPPRLGAPDMYRVENDTAFNESQEGAEACPCPGGPFSAFSRGVTHIHYISGGILWKT